MKWAGISAGTALVCGGLEGKTSVNLAESGMHSSAVAEGETLFDTHAHPPNYRSPFETRMMLSSPGLIGLTRNNATTRNLTWENLLRDHKKQVEVITPGQLARIKYDGRVGSAARTQEIYTANKQGQQLFHMLVFGFDGRYFPDKMTPEDTMKMVHDVGGKIGVAHPYVISPNGTRSARIINEKEEERLIALYTGSETPDFVEVFNSHMIDILSWELKVANKLAEEFAETYNIPGTVCSDTHRRFAQCKMTGIGIPTAIIESQGMPGVLEFMVSGNATRYGSFVEGPYVPASSFLTGMVYEQKCGDKWCGNLL